MTLRSALAVCLLMLACAPKPAEVPVDDAGAREPDDAGVPAADAGPEEMPDAGPVADAGTRVAPQRWPEVQNPVTHDVDTQLGAVLETDALRGACDAVRAGATDDQTVLRCGKWMFFYETFGTIGVPTGLLEFGQKYYADSFYGRGFSKMGFVPDPDDAKGMPLGLAASTGKIGTVTTRAFTCAACHFGQMDDGRYAVGYGNGKLDYGTFLASLGAPLSLSFNADDPNVAPALRQRLGPAVAAAKMNNTGYTAEAGLLGLSLLGAGNAATFTVAEQEQFLTLEHGTMDFLTKPLVDDKVWTVSRIISLWNLPDVAQREAAGQRHEMLAWNGGTKTLGDFLQGFVVLGAGPEWTQQRLMPLERYIRTLRAPMGLTSAGETETGAALFVSKGCLDCHDGASGESSKTWGFSEIGTDAEYAKVFNPPPNGGPCCGLGGDASNITHGVKAPRLAGLFSARRLLHNGSVLGLEELFCLQPRSTTTVLAQTAGGHAMTCDGLSDDEKHALLRYLRSL